VHTYGGSLSVFPVAATLEHRACLKRFVSLQFLNLETVGSTPWTGDQLVARPLPTHSTTQTQNKRRQTSILLVGFEPTIPVRTSEDSTLLAQRMEIKEATRILLRNSVFKRAAIAATPALENTLDRAGSTTALLLCPNM
jgi:hypothetical protein